MDDPRNGATVDVLDIAPTILRLLGVEPRTTLDGHPIVDLPEHIR